MLTKNILIREATPAVRTAIVTMLENSKLPVEDLPSELLNFFIATDNGKVVGVVGLEIHGMDGLLRSLVVDPEYRNQKIADQLIRRLETHARKLKLSAIYLLTETAAKYFSSKGYQSIQRNEVPFELQQSSEFSHVCPASAIVMKKNVDA